MLTQGDIIYFVVTDRFCNGDPHNDYDVEPDNCEGYHGGDFAGIVQKIPYLKNLGITALWITPVYIQTNQPQYHSYGYAGYWPYDFEHVDSHLFSHKQGIANGDKKYLKELVDELHANGIKVILDMVVNHTGYNHPGLWNDPATPIKAHWFNPSDSPGDVKGWLMALPDLNKDNPEVVDYLVNTIIDWIEETGIDCIRMDTVKNCESSFWYHYKTYIKGRFPDVSLLGEVLDFDIDVISTYQKHFAFDSLFDFPLYRAIQDCVIHGAPMTTLSATPWSGDQGLLDKDTHYTNHNRLVTLLDNHDMPARFMSVAVEKMAASRKAAASLQKLALTLQLTTRGIPQIYYGTEIGLEGRGGHDMRRDMPWDIFGDDNEPLPAHKIERDIFEHTKRLIHIRRDNPALCYGSLQTLYADNYLYAFLREFRGNAIVTVINNGWEKMPFPLVISLLQNTNLPPRVQKLFEDNPRLRNLLNPSDRDIPIKNGCFHVQLPGKSAVVLHPAGEGR
jgi:alpha-amylase